MKRFQVLATLIASMALVAAICTGCSSASAEIENLITKQADAVSSESATETLIQAIDPSIDSLAAVGISSESYCQQMIGATSLDVGEIKVDDDSARAELTLSCPDTETMAALLKEKSQEFGESDDYLTLGKEGRFPRAQEAFAETLAAAEPLQKTLSVSLSKDDQGWTLDKSLSESVANEVFTPDQAARIAKAMSPYGWKYDDMNASQILEAMKASGLSMGDIQVFDETNDPNGLLGRPGSYVSKAHFLDTRVSDPYGFEWFEGEINTDYGGTVEVFETAEAAQSRAQYIQGIVDAGASFGAMYTYLKDNVLLRVGYELTPSQAAEYEAEFLQRTAVEA